MFVLSDWRVYFEACQECHRCIQNCEQALAWMRRQAEVGAVRGVRHGLLPDLAALSLLLPDLGHQSLYVILRGILFCLTQDLLMRPEKRELK